MKIPGIVVGCIGSLYLVFSFFDGMKDEIGDVQETVDHINIEQSWMAEDITALQDTLARFEAEHRKQGKDIETLTWGLNQHENFTPEQFEDIMKELLKKNTSWNPYPIMEIPLGGLYMPEEGSLTLNLHQ